MALAVLPCWAPPGDIIILQPNPPEEPETVPLVVPVTPWAMVLRWWDLLNVEPIVEDPDPQVVAKPAGDA